MDKKEARKILGVMKETNRNELERKYSILLKKHRAAGTAASQTTGETHAAVQEEYTFEQITQAYNVLMGYEVAIKEEPPGKAAPLLKKAGIDEKKARNFFYYYKWHIVAVIILLAVTGSIIRGCVTNVKPDFTTAFVGVFDYSDTSKLKAAIQENIPDIKEPGFDGAYLDENDQSQQAYAMFMKATVLFAAGDIDVYILDKASYERFAKQGAFLSLDEIASKVGADPEKNKDLILKADTSGAHLYGIDVSSGKLLKDSGIIGKEFIAAIYVNCKQTDKAEKLLQLLMK